MGFLVGDVIMGACCFFGQLYLALGANPTSHCFGSKFFGNLAIIGVFRALDWLSGIFRAKIMAQKTKIVKKFKSHQR